MRGLQEMCVPAVAILWYVSRRLIKGENAQERDMGARMFADGMQQTDNNEQTAVPAPWLAQQQ